MELNQNLNTPVIENLKLLYANSYGNLVHGLGAFDTRPEPYSWNGWTLVQYNGQWMYHNPLTDKFITPAVLHAMIGGVAQEHVDGTISGRAKAAFASGWGALVVIGAVMLWPEFSKLVRGR